MPFSVWKCNIPMKSIGIKFSESDIDVKRLMLISRTPTFGNMCL